LILTTIIQTQLQHLFKASFEPISIKNSVKKHSPSKWWR